MTALGAEDEASTDDKATKAAGGPSARPAVDGTAAAVNAGAEANGGAKAAAAAGTSSGRSTASCFVAEAGRRSTGATCKGPAPAAALAGGGEAEGARGRALVIQEADDAGGARKQRGDMHPTPTHPCRSRPAEASEVAWVDPDWGSELQRWRQALRDVELVLSGAPANVIELHLPAADGQGRSGLTGYRGGWPSAGAMPEDPEPIGLAQYSATRR